MASIRNTLGRLTAGLANIHGHLPGAPEESRNLNVRIFLGDEHTTESALITAAGTGEAFTVETLLRRGVNPATNDNEALMMAIINGHTDIVRILLAYRNESHRDYEVNPAENDNDPLMLASSEGHADIVKMLLRYTPPNYHLTYKVNPAAQDNEAIIVASAMGQFDVVDLLLRDARVDPTARENSAIREACNNEYFEVVGRLLADPRIHTNCASLNVALQEIALQEFENNDSPLTELIEYVKFLKRKHCASKSADVPRTKKTRKHKNRRTRSA